MDSLPQLICFNTKVVVIMFISANLCVLVSGAVQQSDIVGGARKLHSLAGSIHDKMSSLTIDQFITTYHDLFEWTSLPKVCHLLCDIFMYHTSYYRDDPLLQFHLLLDIQNFV